MTRKPSAEGYEKAASTVGEKTMTHTTSVMGILFTFFSVQAAFAGNVVINGNTGVSSISKDGGQAVSTGCVQGNGVQKSEERMLGDVTKVVLNGAYDVGITSGKERGFTIRGDENIIGLIASEEEGDTVHVYPRQSICPRRDLLIDITLETLEHISASGTVHAILDGVQGDSLKIEIDGSSTVVASGKTQALAVTIGGTGKLQANDLHAESAMLSINGVGEAYVYATDHLSANIMGVGNIYYSGNPQKVERSITGVGSVVAQ